MKKLAKYFICLAIVLPMIGGLTINVISAENQVTPRSFSERVIKSEDKVWESGYAQFPWYENQNYITITFMRNYTVSKKETGATTFWDALAGNVRYHFEYTYKTN